MRDVALKVSVQTDETKAPPLNWRVFAISMGVTFILVALSHSGILPDFLK